MTKKEELKEIYSGVDVFKAIAAILVVVLHAIETTDYFACGIKFTFTRLAVPFFFIVSGFFFCRGLNKAEDKKKYFYRYEKNLLKIFFVWGILIYGPFTISSYIANNASSGVIKIVFLLIRRILIIGPGPYWYLIALFWSVAFIYFCYTKKKDWLIILGIIIGLMLEIAYACFRGVLSGIAIFKYIFEIVYFIYSWEFNFIMFGIPFVGIGYFLYKKNVHIDMKISTVVLIGTTILRLVEYRLPILIPSKGFWANNEISIAFIVQSIAFFLLAKELNFKISKEKSITLRQWSSFLYFSHAIILYNILNPMLERFTSLPVYAPEFVICKILIVLVICTMLFFLIKRINNKHLNILING